MRRSFGWAMAVAIGAMAVPAGAGAHVERPAYWPDPAPDCSISPCAGGAVPKARTLASSLDTPATTKVVCQPDSLTRVQQSIDNAVNNGYVVRPTQPRKKITATEGSTLLDLNKKLNKRCK